MWHLSHSELTFVTIFCRLMSHHTKLYSWYSWHGWMFSLPSFNPQVTHSTCTSAGSLVWDTCFGDTSGVSATVHTAR